MTGAWEQHKSEQHCDHCDDLGGDECCFLAGHAAALGDVARLKALLTRRLETIHFEYCVDAASAPGEGKWCITECREMAEALALTAPHAAAPAAGEGGSR